MLVMYRTTLARPAGMTNGEFYGVWLEEAQATVEALAAGTVKAAWKVPGRDEVIGVVEVEDADALDRAVQGLPLWSRGYAHLVDRIDWTLLRPYEAWAEDLQRLARGEPLP